MKLELSGSSVEYCSSRERLFNLDSGEYDCVPIGRARYSNPDTVLGLNYHIILLN